MKKDSEKKITMDLPVPMSDAEVASRSQEMASLVVEQTAIETELAAFGADKRKRLREIRKETKRLAQAVKDRAILAKVDCVEKRLFSQNAIEIYRKDLGTLVQRRAMEGAERQTEIDVGDAPRVALEEQATQ